MSHLLKTMNPEAAEEIEHGATLPDIGTMVVYLPRSGEQRMGRREFPAIVLKHNDDDDTVELMVMMEPEDMRVEPRVSYQSHNAPQHCWRHIRSGKSDAALQDENERINAQAARIVQLEETVAALTKQVWGDYNPTNSSIFDHLAEFESKLNAGNTGKAKKG